MTLDRFRELTRGGSVTVGARVGDKVQVTVERGRLSTQTWVAARIVEQVRQEAAERQGDARR